MPKIVGVEEIDHLVAEGGQLVEVLPGDEYEWAHLPGAVSAPLKQLEAHAGELDRDRPVIAYCHDSLCDLSPRAAWRLEHLGFRESYDYALSKMDWIGRGRDYEGTADLVLRHLDRDVPTCAPTTSVAAVREHIERAGICVVINDARVVFGAVDARSLDGRTGETVETVMRPGISTIRPGEERDKLDARLSEKNLSRIVVTDPQGCLLGIYRRT